MAPRSPGGALRLTFYGDDFTGSTDAMEGLALSGVRTVLFLDCPAPETLARYPGLGAAGVAGMSRTMTPRQMDETLPAAFAGLRRLGAPLCHYKVCSTFDSSPEIGSIGRAIEIGRRAFSPVLVPIVAGMPALGRYCAFGNLFARSGAESPVYRLDRHPTMRHHPVTPMDESDVRVHLARQTDLPVALFDATELDGPPATVEARFAALLAGDPGAVLFDVMHDGHLAAIGRLLGPRASIERPLFAAGSSAVEYALSAYWRETGAITAPADASGPAFAPRLTGTPGAPGIGGDGPCQVAVVSGSCSPVTARQIEHALRHEFGGVPVQADLLVDPKTAAAEQARAVAAALDVLAGGRSVVIHTCLGSGDPRIAATTRRLDAMGRDRVAARIEAGALLGDSLGAILRRVLERTGLRRAAVAGGDTSSHVARRLGLEALEMLAPCAPGSPLCRAYAPGSPLDGIEVVFKGGQNGTEDFFRRLLRRPSPPRDARETGTMDGARPAMAAHAASATTRGTRHDRSEREGDPR